LTCKKKITVSDEDCEKTNPVKMLGESWNPRREKTKIKVVVEGFKRLNGNVRVD